MGDVPLAAKRTEEAVSLYQHEGNRDISERLTILAETVGKSLSSVLSSGHLPFLKSLVTREFDHEDVRPVLRDMKFKRAIDQDGRPFNFYIYDSTEPWIALNPIAEARPTSVHAHGCVCCSSVLCGPAEFLLGLDIGRGFWDPIDRKIVSTTTPILINRNVLHQILTPEFAWYITCFEGPLSELTVFDHETEVLRPPSWQGVYRSLTLMSDHSFVGGLSSDDSPESRNKVPISGLSSSGTVSRNGNGKTLISSGPDKPKPHTWVNEPIRRPCDAARLARLLGMSDWHEVDDLALVQRIEAGLPFQSIEKIASAINPDDRNATIALLSGSDYSDLKMKSEQRLTKELSQKLYRISRVLDEALRLWNDDEKAVARFLHRPHQLLSRRTPFDLTNQSTAGADLVIKLLGEARAGVAI